MQRDFDLIIYGATGFTGQLATHYMMQNGIGDCLRIAIAGRNADKLRKLQLSCAIKPAILIADSTQPETVRAMVQKTKVILSFAGPFAHYGENIIAACAKYGVDYLDITGETPFIRTMIERYQSLAVQTGARLIPFSGFDSVPADLTVYLALAAARIGNFELDELCLYYQIKGGLNGGTLESALAMAEQNQIGFNNPNSLIPDQSWRLPKSLNFKPRFETLLKRYSIPFFMYPINLAVVRRSAWLRAQLGFKEPAFQYEERLLMGRRFGLFKALTTNIVLAGFNLLSKRSLGRRFIRYFGPKPGEGPSEEVRKQGFFRGQLIGRTKGKTKVIVTMEREGDPGNSITILLACESARLAAENDFLPGISGFLTPTTSFGDKLRERLEKVGFRFNKLPVPLGTDLPEWS